MGKGTANSETDPELEPVQVGVSSPVGVVPSTGGLVLTDRGGQGWARWWPPQGTPLLSLQAHKRLECQAAGQEHATGGDDGQEGIVNFKYKRLLPSKLDQQCRCPRSSAVGENATCKPGQALGSRGVPPRCLQMAGAGQAAGHAWTAGAEQA